MISLLAPALVLEMLATSKSPATLRFLWMQPRGHLLFQCTDVRLRPCQVEKMRHHQEAEPRAVSASHANAARSERPRLQTLMAQKNGEVPQDGRGPRLQTLTSQRSGDLRARGCLRRCIRLWPPRCEACRGGGHH